jgi:hydrogenase expression/formation protein HypC
MCIGRPVRVLQSGEGFALCDDAGDHCRIDMRLVGDQPVGAWVLVFMDAAREVLTESRAHQIRNALAALQAAAVGDPVEHLFADLIDREPTLPEFLQAKN